MTVAPVGRARATTSSHRARKAPLGACLQRIWMNRAPPARYASARAETVHPDRRATSASMMALRGERIRRPRRGSFFFARRREALHELRAQTPRQEVGVAENAQVHGNGRLDSLHHRHLQRALHANDRFVAVAAVGNHFGDHRVVVRRNRAIGVGGRVDADAWPATDAEHADVAGRRHERLGIFGIHPALDRVAVEGDLALPERQPLAGRYPDLLLHDVDAGHELGHRMFDLEARVRFHEIEPGLVVHEELEGSRVGVLHRLGGVDDQVPQLATLLLGERRRR